MVVSHWPRHELLALWFCLLLWLRFSFLFHVPRFSAVGDLGQEFANTFDVCFAPDVYSCAAASDGFGRRHLADLDIVGKRAMRQSKLPSRLPC